MIHVTSLVNFDCYGQGIVTLRNLPGYGVKYRFEGKFHKEGAYPIATEVQYTRRREKGSKHGL